MITVIGSELGFRLTSDVLCSVEQNSEEHQEKVRGEIGDLEEE